MLTESGLEDGIEVVGVLTPLRSVALLALVLEHVLFEVARVVVAAVADGAVVQVARRV